jgi:hypothetical protein
MYARREDLHVERAKVDARAAKERATVFTMPAPDAGESRDDKWARLAALALAVDRMATNAILSKGLRGDPFRQSQESGLHPDTCEALARDQRHRAALNKHAADEWRHPERTRAK